MILKLCKKALIVNVLLLEKSSFFLFFFMLYWIYKIGKGVRVMSQYKCPFCGKDIHPGDQVCLFCGKKIPNVTMTIQDLNSKNSMNITTKKNKTIFYLSVSLVCVMILVSFLIVWFGIIKG